MVGTSRGLGRGLDALLGGSAAKSDPAPGEEIRRVALEEITPNKYQPRSDFDEEALADLCASIKAQGVLQPVLLRPLKQGGYELVAGERRFRASTLAGLTEIPAIIRDMSDEQSLAIALIENLQREDLNAIEEAKGYKQLQEEFGLNQEMLASQVGKSRSAVANTMRLLNLSEPIQKSIADGKISAGHGRAIMALADEGSRKSLFERIATLGLSVRQAESEAVYYKENGSFPDTSGSKPEKGSGRGPSRRSEHVDEKLASLGKELQELLGVKVAVGGTHLRGKITLKFGSEQELDSLVSQIGLKKG